MMVVATTRGGPSNRHSFSLEVLCRNHANDPRKLATTSLLPRGRRDDPGNSLSVRKNVIT